MVFCAYRVLILLICIGFIAVQPDEVYGLTSVELVLRHNQKDQGIVPQNQRVLTDVDMQGMDIKKSAHASKTFDRSQSSKRGVRRGSDPIHNRKKEGNGLDPEKAEFTGYCPNKKKKWALGRHMWCFKQTKVNGLCGSVLVKGTASQEPDCHMLPNFDTNLASIKGEIFDREEKRQKRRLLRRPRDQYTLDVQIIAHYFAGDELCLMNEGILSFNTVYP
ncbi:hypothetical protein SADUNF_Sadunf08G0068800 [Salix dunnii]|uniref:Uncharacterized protein n=1 Tax=Salix dunnii TaxID=1413687 RepID=A0A835JZM2_9ROSI|nr:hypothetical protein SADUNF_Sadunf08G0068800 [Salix dunnii]